MQKQSPSRAARATGAPTASAPFVPSLLLPTHVACPRTLLNISTFPPPALCALALAAVGIFGPTVLTTVLLAPALVDGPFFAEADMEAEAGG